MINTTGTATDPFITSAAGFSPLTGENDGVREKLRIIANAITNNREPALSCRAVGLHAGDPRHQRYAERATDAPSPSPRATILQRHRPNSSSIPASTLSGAAAASAFTTGGVDGTNGLDPDVASFEGNGVDQTGMHALDPVDLFNLMVIPRDEALDDSDDAARCGGGRASTARAGAPSW